MNPDATESTRSGFGKRPNALYILDKPSLEKTYSPTARMKIERLTRVLGPPMSVDEASERPELLAEMQILFSGWGGIRLDAAFLHAAPKLKAMFFAAGSIRGAMTPEAWQRGIDVVSAYAINAGPVAELTLSQILFALKLGWQHMLKLRDEKQWQTLPQTLGVNGASVGLVSLGQVAQQLCKLLRPFNVRVLAYDPFADSTLADQCGVELVDLPTLFDRSEVVSLHTPLLPGTRGLIDGSLLRRMRPWSTLINTARGGIVDQEALTQMLRERPDVVALLDVVDPEPPTPDMPLWDVPNAVLLPHIAGAMGRECHRLGEAMAEELERYLNGEPLRWQITQEAAQRLA